MPSRSSCTSITSRVVPGDSGHDRHLAAGQQVDQARLAHVGRADHRHCHAGSQPLALAPVREVACHLPRSTAEIGQHLRQHGAGHILVGREVDLGLE